jgi:hypothetical protein
MEIKITFIFKITKNYFMDGFAFSSWIYLHAGGILGSLLPVLPGPAISWLGILLLYCKRYQ